MTTDTPDTFDAGDMMQRGRLRHGAAPPRDQVYEAAGIGPEDVDVVELHDCFTANELLTYEALGLSPEGTAEKFIRDGDNTYGGTRRHQPVRRPAVQGPPARRHRPRAVRRAGLAAARRGRRAPGRGRALALQHNLGLGGACVVTLYEKVG